MFFPDPVMMKLDEIQNSITVLGSKVDMGFAESTLELSSVICRDTLSNHVNEISTSYEDLKEYYRSRGNEAYARTLKDRYPGVPEALNFIFRVLTQDEPNCNILEVYYNGDSRNGYMRGSPRVVASANNYLMWAQKGMAVTAVVLAKDGYNQQMV
jgi:hypothetical protein